MYIFFLVTQKVCLTIDKGFSGYVLSSYTWFVSLFLCFVCACIVNEFDGYIITLMEVKIKYPVS